MTQASRTATQPATPTRFALPWDLEEWIDRSRIVDWVREEVDSLGWEKPEVLAYLRSHPVYRPRTMLLMLTWGYITGRLGFSEIKDPCGSDPRLQALLRNEIPAVNSLARFRRDNRALLKWSVAQVFKRAVRERFELVREELLPAGLRRHLENEAANRVDLARQVESGLVGA